MKVQKIKRIIRTPLTFAILMVLSCSFSAMAEEVSWKKIIDYGDPGYSETGISWRTYGPNPQAYQGSYRYLSWWERGIKRVGTATWQTVAPYSGTYKVSVSYRRTENRSPDADFYVTNSEGEMDHFSINQTGHLKFIWKTLGVYHYSKGQRIKVFLDGTDDTYSDCADAASWELVKVDDPPKVPGTAIKLLLDPEEPAKK